jgi:hypothetical protein
MTNRKRTKGQTMIYKYTHKTKDRVTRTPLKTGGDLTCSDKVNTSCSTSGTRRVNLVSNSVISYELGKDREVLTTRGTYLWSFVTIGRFLYDTKEEFTVFIKVTNVSGPPWPQTYGS